MLCDIQPGDEVILPSFTYVSTANAFVLRGAVLVFVDIRADTLNIDGGPTIWQCVREYGGNGGHL